MFRANKLFSVSDKEYIDIVGKMSDLERLLRRSLGKNNREEIRVDPKAMSKVLGNILNGSMESPILELVSGKGKLKITMADQEEIPNFEEMDPSIELLHSNKTPRELSPMVYRVAERAVYRDIFDFFPCDLEKLVLSWKEIKGYCAKYRHLLREGITHFLVQDIEGKFHVIYVEHPAAVHGSLIVRHSGFRDNNALYGESHFIVVPDAEDDGEAV